MKKHISIKIASILFICLVLFASSFYLYIYLDMIHNYPTIAFPGHAVNSWDKKYKLVTIKNKMRTQMGTETRMSFEIVDNKTKAIVYTSTPRWLRSHDNEIYAMSWVDDTYTIKIDTDFEGISYYEYQDGDWKWVEP